MPGWIQAIFAFFFKYRPAVFAKGDLVFGAPASVILLLLAGAVIGVPAVLTYASVRGRSSRRDRWVLGSLRVASLLVLMVCLFRPMLLLSAAVPQRNFVGVLIDDSRSMGIADVEGKPRSAFALNAFGGPDSAILKTLREKFQVRLFRFGGSAQRIDSASQLDFKEQETHLGDAIERARQELDAVPVSGLVVISDGADNSGTPITEQLLALRAQSVPVFTVGVGSEHFDRDIEVQRVEVPHTILKGAAISADVLVRQRGFGGKRVPLIVEDNGHIVSQDTITLANDGDVALTHINVMLKEPGARVLTFRIPVQPGEKVTQNNAQMALVDVRAQREKILYVEGEPRSEMRFIRAAVASDSNLQLVTLQRTAEGNPTKFLRLSVDDSTELTVRVSKDSLVAGFPTSRAELFKYRAIVLGSVEASFFTSDQLKMLADFVSIRGGGMLFLGGHRSFAEGGYAGTPIADVMPVIVTGAGVADTATFLADLAVSLTPEGKNSSVTQVASTPDKSIARWAKVPNVTSSNYITTTVKPGAITLIAGRTPNDGRSVKPNGENVPNYAQPVLVYQRYGRGLSVALPIQDSYLWQMDPKTPDDDIMYQTFWRQLLRWLTSDVPGHVSVAVSPDQVTPKSPVTVRAVVTDSVYSPRNDAQVVAHVTSKTGVSQDVPLQWVVDRDGEYHASFTPDDSGLYTVRVVAMSDDSTHAPTRLGADSVIVRVGDLNAEYIDAEMNASLLKRIADETGGKYYTPASVKTLAEDVSMSKRGITVINQMDLWDMPFNFLLLIALVSAEWAYRKSRGLA